MSDPQLEARLKATLTTVAEQTEVDADPSLLQAGVRRGQPDGRGGGGDQAAGSRSRYLWLAGVAAVILVTGAIGGVILAGSRGVDLGTVGPADEPGPTSLIEPGDIGSDNILYLLPPTSGLDGATFEGLTVEGSAGSSVVSESDRSSILIGRPTPDGAEDLVLVFNATTDGSFAINQDVSVEVAGRELFDSFDEGVAEPLDDGSWTIYQTEFGDPRLDDLVAGTSLVEGLLLFDGAESGLETIASIDDNGSTEMAVLIDDEPDGPDDRGFRLVTSSADDESEAMVLAAGFAATELRSTSVGGRPGYVFSVEMPEGDVTILGWSPIDGHVAAMIVWGRSETDAVDFAASFISVDAQSWGEAVDG